VVMFPGCPHELPAVGPRVPTSAVPMKLKQQFESTDFHKVLCEVKTHRHLKMPRVNGTTRPVRGQAGLPRRCSSEEQTSNSRVPAGGGE